MKLHVQSAVSTRGFRHGRKGLHSYQKHRSEKIPDQEMIVEEHNMISINLTYYLR